ncbi:restriction endonuclease subunit S [Pseudanabaena sp. FACHB-2040]|uniref:restriction endonuclease subunit S n=1 Tax=Pseudanabaena sp. FACHB-2040 TaxID=2692859 RepID=UPI0016824252|nr:restriction endonuclease subunit S [Pseudanabaena sp. FACHB-2040]MBD2261143.1 restriction endonuclease subunit S [Pseudanabaena sp. FACHB-2040]
MIWQTKPIGEFCRTGSGGTPSREQEAKYYSGTIPWVKSGELRESIVFDTEEKITEVALKETSVKMIPSGALLVAMYGATVGRIAILGIEATSNQAVCHIVPDEKIADQRYMFHALQQQVPKWLEQRVGGAQPNISQQIIRNTPIPLPPLEEQRRIAAILDKADEVRRKRREAIRLTEELLRSQFLEMFGDPISNPKGWRSVELEHLAKVTDGTHKTPTYLDFGVPFLSARNVRSHKIDWQDTRFISQAEHESLTRRCHPQKGDVLLTKSGTIGEAAVVDRDMEFSLFESVALIKLKDSSIHPIFLATLLNEPCVRSHYSGDIKGVAVKHLHLVDIKRLPIILPSQDKQDLFLQQATKTWECRSKLSQAYAKSEGFFNSLLQQAFRGEL